MSATSNARIWSMARELGHGFTLSGRWEPRSDGGETFVPTSPDFNRSAAEFDAACVELDKSRNDRWPSIGCWARLPNGEARHMTGSGRTRIAVAKNGDTTIETMEAGFPSSEELPAWPNWEQGKPCLPAKPDGKIEIRGRQAAVTGTPSATAHRLLYAVAGAEGWPLEPEVTARHLRELGETTLAQAVEDGRVAVPAGILTLSDPQARVEGVVVYVRSLPVASLVLAHALGEITRTEMTRAILARAG